jgi:type IV pilus assembly protein PilA
MSILRKTRAFTLVEIMIVVSVIALLAAIAIPAFARARKRSQATMVKNDLRLIDDALAQYAMEQNINSGELVPLDDCLDYIKDDSRLANTGQDVFGHDFSDQMVDALPQVPGATWDMLSDVVDTSFWSPYAREVASQGSSSAPAPPPRQRRPRRRRPWGG